jgi:magnesium-transporting ATPase (P-type)
MTSKFKLTLKELVTLMEARSHEALEKYKDLGGSDGLAKKLDSNPEKGLSGDEEDIQSRKQAFGVNFIPPKKAKSFWQLALDACEDPTLIILIICAFISIALATYGFMTHGDQNENLVCFPN